MAERRVFEEGDRVKQVVAELKPLRYVTQYGTVQRYDGTKIRVLWDDGVLFEGYDSAVETLDTPLPHPEPIAYLNPDRSRWGKRNLNQWATKPFE